MHDRFRSLNPTTGVLEAEFEFTSDAALADCLARLDAATTAWRETHFLQKAGLLRRLALLLREHADEWARLAALEMGKPLAEGTAEVEKCAWVCEHYAEHAASYLVPDAIATDGARSYVRYEPLGAILAVMPWNFPYWQVFRFAAPALMAGNVCLLKPAPSVPRCALAIDSLFREAEFPEGVFQSAFVPVDRLEEIVSHSAIRAVTLTGGERAGRSLAALAGKHTKKAVLELGGSDPFLVLADADLPFAAHWAAKSRTLNAGQSCIAAKRFFVDARVADDFVERLRAELSSLTVGDPLAPGTTIGPLARADLRDNLDRQVRDSVSAGASLLLGGSQVDGAGFFYPPTLLDHVRPGMPAFDEETFGPVAAIIRVADEREAVCLANASRFGLGASVWSRNVARAESLAPLLDVGSVFVNGMVKSDPRLPFGGVKASGYGRELSGIGMREFVNVKTVWIGG